MVYSCDRIGHSNEKDQTVIHNMKESHRFHFDWNKPDTKDYITYDPICISSKTIYDDRVQAGFRVIISSGKVYGVGRGLREPSWFWKELHILADSHYTGFGVNIYPAELHI